MIWLFFSYTAPTLFSYFPQTYDKRVFCSLQMRGYPVYEHELDELFLYYNSSQGALVIGRLQSQGLLKVQPISGAEMTSDVDYSQSHLFAFSAWKQWDPSRRQFVENSHLSDVRPQCVDEKVGFCSSGYLHPTNFFQVTIMRVLPLTPETSIRKFEFVEFGKMHFRLLDGVFHNLRPVYEMAYEGQNRTAQDRTVQQYYLYHKDGKWRVGAEIGLVSLNTGIFLELEGNAMRVEYENGTAWQWLQFSPVSSAPTYRKAFGGLQCSRQLPGGMSCQAADDASCDNGGTCHTDTDGLSSCLCRAGYRGIQCKHPLSTCAASLKIPRHASSVFISPAPHYDGTIVTVFCSSGEYTEYSVCQNASWQPTSETLCSVPMTTTVKTISTTTWSPMYNQSDTVYASGDSFATVVTVIGALVCIQLGCPFLCYCCSACSQSDDERIDDELPADTELKLDTPKRKASLQSTCSRFFYLCWWLWLMFAVIYLVLYGGDTLDGSTVLSAVAIMSFVCLGVLYFCVFFESFCSHEYEYLAQLENEEVTAGEQVTEMKAAKPIITFRAECSHDETRTQTVQPVLLILLRPVSRLLVPLFHLLPNICIPEWVYLPLFIT